MASKGSWSYEAHILVERDTKKSLSKHISTIISGRRKSYEENNDRVGIRRHDLRMTIEHVRSGGLN